MNSNRCKVNMQDDFNMQASLIYLLVIFIVFVPPIRSDNGKSIITLISLL